MLYAWPSNDEVVDLAIGESLHMDVVAKAEVQSDGSFELRLENGADLSEYASESGDLNLELSAEFDGGLYEQNIALDLGDVEDAEPDEAPLQSVEVAEPIAVAPDTSQASGYVEKACFTKKLKEYPSQWVPIASIFSTNTGTVITHTYTSGHTSTLGVAVSKTSAGSGFSASGSVAVSSTGEIGYAPIKGKTSKQLRTKFQYAKFLHACAGKGSSTQKWVVRPYNRIGGSSSVAATIPAAKFCVPYRKNDHYTRDQ